MSRNIAETSIQRRLQNETVMKEDEYNSLSEGGKRVDDKTGQAIRKVSGLVRTYIYIYANIQI